MGVSVDVMGRVGFREHISVSTAEMATWEPERITAFFTGIAIAIRAARGPSVELAEPHSWFAHEEPVGIEVL